MSVKTQSWDIPIRLPSMANGRMHWATKARIVKKQRDAVALLVRHVSIKPPCLVTLTRFGPRSLDCDNLQSSFKAVRDEVASLLHVDDADPRVRWEYRQARGPYGCVIEITAG